MADEISYTAKLAVTKSNLSYTRTVSDAVDMTGSTHNGGSPSIPITTAGTALALGDVTTPGWAFFRNLDATNFIEIGIQQGGVFYPFLKLKAGDATACRLGTTAPYARANTAAARLEFAIFQD